MNPSIETLANLLNLDIKYTQKLIDDLLSLKLIKKVGKYYRRESRHLDTSSLDHNDLLKLKTYWIKYSLEKFEQKKESENDISSSYLIYSSNAELDNEIRDRFIKFYYDVVKIIRSPNKKSLPNV